MVLDDTGIIDAETKKQMENENIKLTRYDIFKEMREVDKFVSPGFITFITSYRPTSFTDIIDKLEIFSRVQNKQVERLQQERQFEYIDMLELTPDVLNDYTVFLGKYGKYITMEVKHA